MWKRLGWLPAGAGNRRPALQQHLSSGESQPGGRDDGGDENDGGDKDGGGDYVVTRWTSSLRVLSSWLPSEEATPHNGPTLSDLRTG